MVTDWAHLLVACLVHDIGYVRDILAGDDALEGYVVDGVGTRVVLGRWASDAALTPHHMERSKLFVAARFGTSDLLDAKRIAPFSFVNSTVADGFDGSHRRRFREFSGPHADTERPFHLLLLAP